jgi:hypothetical protein
LSTWADTDPATNVAQRPTSKNLQETGLSLRERAKNASSVEPTFKLALIRACFCSAEGSTQPILTNAEPRTNVRFVIGATKKQGWWHTNKRLTKSGFRRILDRVGP